MKQKLSWKKLFVHLILIAGLGVTIFPFLWMVLTSFKTSGEAMAIPPTIFPNKISLQKCHFYPASFRTHGSGADFPDSAVSDYPEDGTFGYDSGTFYPESFQRLRHLFDAPVLSFFTG